MIPRPLTLALVFAALLLHVLAGTPAACAAVPEPAPAAYVASPWLASMASFIVGTTIKIQPLSHWSEDGRLVSIRRPPANSTIIALDPKEAARYSLKPDRKDLFLLYENLPVKDSRRSSLFFDLSVLPFLSQRMLVVLCRMRPENYAYYQRRLAEFQSRLESTLEVGRSLLPEVQVLDMTGASGPWIRAAMPKAVRPPDSLWLAWEKGEQQDDLDSALAEAKKRSWRVILDVWTPAPIRAKITDAHASILVKAPTKDQDFFTYLHDVYLAIWSALTKDGK